MKINERTVARRSVSSLRALPTGLADRAAGGAAAALAAVIQALPALGADVADEV